MREGCRRFLEKHHPVARDQQIRLKSGFAPCRGVAQHKAGIAALTSPLLRGCNQIGRNIKPDNLRAWASALDCQGQFARTATDIKNACAIAQRNPPQ